MKLHCNACLLRISIFDWLNDQTQNVLFCLIDTWPQRQNIAIAFYSVRYRAGASFFVSFGIRPHCIVFTVPNVTQKICSENGSHWDIINFYLIEGSFCNFDSELFLYYWRWSLGHICFVFHAYMYMLSFKLRTLLA